MGLKMTKQDAAETVASLLEQANEFVETARKLAKENGLAFYYDGTEFEVGQDEDRWCGSSC